MGSKRTSITHVADVERLAQELKHCKQKDKQKDLLEELGEVALLPPGRDSILAHGGIGVITEQLTVEDPNVRLAADETLRRLITEERCRLQVVKKLVPLLKHHSLRTRLHACAHVANLASETTLNRAWLISAGVLPPLTGFVSSDDVALRETALGALAWLSQDRETPKEVGATPGVSSRLLKSVLAPCGSLTERRFALTVLGALPDDAPDLPLRGLFKCLAAQLGAPDANDKFSVSYPVEVLTA